MLKNIKKYILTALYSCCIAALSLSQIMAQDTIPLTESGQKFNEQEWNDLRSDSEFNYEPKVNIFSEFIKRILRPLLRGILGKDFKIGNLDWLEYVVYVVAGGIFLWFLVKVIKAQGGWLFYRSRKSDSLNDMFSSEEFKGTNLEEAIANAIKARDYRLAIRYLFLSNLSKLNTLHYIQWAPDKTNMDYVRELRGKDFSEAFINNARVFEYIWYGKYDPDQDLFERLKDDFLNLDSRLVK